MVMVWHSCGTSQGCNQTSQSPPGRERTACQLCVGQAARNISLQGLGCCPHYCGESQHAPVGPLLAALYTAGPPGMSLPWQWPGMEYHRRHTWRWRASSACPACRCSWSCRYRSWWTLLARCRTTLPALCSALIENHTNKVWEGDLAVFIKNEVFDAEIAWISPVHHLILVGRHKPRQGISRTAGVHMGRDYLSKGWRTIEKEVVDFASILWREIDISLMVWS